DVTEHDSADQILDRPAVLDETQGQLVEQFGVRGPIPLGTEVVDAAHQSLAQEVLPDAVDQHACRERVRGVRHPPGQLQPPRLSRRDCGYMAGSSGADEAARYLGA